MFPIVVVRLFHQHEGQHRRLARLHQREHFEGFIVRAQAARKNSDRLRFTSLDNLVDRWKLRLTNKVEIEKEYETRARVNAVHAAIERLSFDQRVVIVLFYLQGFSLAEIADILSVPVGTAKSRLHYARKAMERTLLADAQFRGEVAYEPL